MRNMPGRGWESGGQETGIIGSGLCLGQHKRGAD
jgi:hypothetical protein